MSVDQYTKDFQSLKVARRAGQVSPHKPCMLLAVIGLSESGMLEQNKIYLNQGLLQRYYEIFDCVRAHGDHPNPYFPFFHLKSEGFWHLHPLQGRADVLRAMKTARSIREIRENIDYASLDDGLFQLLRDTERRVLLKDALVTQWFGRFKQQLGQIFAQDAYEKNLRFEAPDAIREASTRYDKPVRDAAFRRVVTEAYDFRCAASGHRLILPDGKVLVQAAHIIPFSESYDDDPKNGIALTPDYHWAFDRGVISPGPDLKWHVSKDVDERIADNRFLLALDGKDLILPKQQKYWPKEDALVARFSSFS